MRWAMGFLGVAILVAVIGFVGMARQLAGTACEAAVAGKWVLCMGLVLAGVALLRGPRRVRELT